MFARTAVALSLGLMLAGIGGSAFAADHKDGDDGPKDALSFKVKNIDGKEVDLDQYRGKVVLIVNVASKCGYTPQYEQLQALHEKYHDKGLRILGFPANNFGGQEPGSNQDIKQFCTTKYNVGFDMFSKISVKGDDIAPLYAYLTSKKEQGDLGGDIKWNFTKFLLNRNGEVIARFESAVKPDDPKVIDALEKALAEKPEKPADTEA